MLRVLTVCTHSKSKCNKVTPDFSYQCPESSNFFGIDLGGVDSIHWKWETVPRQEEVVFFFFTWTMVTRENTISASVRIKVSNGGVNQTFAHAFDFPSNLS